MERPGEKKSVTVTEQYSWAVTLEGTNGRKLTARMENGTGELFTIEARDIDPSDGLTPVTVHIVVRPEDFAEWEAKVRGRLIEDGWKPKR